MNIQQLYDQLRSLSFYEMKALFGLFDIQELLSVRINISDIILDKLEKGQINNE